MRIEYDKKVDALYIRIQQKKVCKTKEIEEGVYIDFDKDGKVVGIEILDVSTRYKRKDIFNVSTENLILTS